MSFSSQFPHCINRIRALTDGYGNRNRLSRPMVPLGTLRFRNREAAKSHKVKKSARTGSSKTGTSPMTDIDEDRS